MEKIGDEVRDISDEIPFDIPESWEWCRLGDYVQKVTDYVASGSFASLRENVKIYKEPNYAILVKTKDFQKNFTEDLTYTDKHGYEFLENSRLFGGELIMPNIGASIGKVFKVPNLNAKMTLAPNSVLIRFISDEYLKWFSNFFLSPLGFALLKNISSSTAQAKFSKTEFKNILFPVPPLSEQHRIVAKIEELLPHIENYTEVETKLNALNTTFPTQLKKSILQQAVQGKLVTQNPDDEPASVLLERIRAEKQELIKAGKIKKDKNESVIFRRDNSHYEMVNGVERCIDDEIPFEVPESWQWEHWGNISISIQYGYNAAAQSTGRIKMVRISDIQNNTVMWDSVPFCDISEADIETYKLKTNDILFARTGGTVGKSYLVKDVPEDAVYAGYLIRTRYSLLLCPEFLKYFMESELYWSQLRSGTIATAQPNCNGKTLANMFIPIPPFEEQRNIVKRISQLFKYCEKL